MNEAVSVELHISIHTLTAVCRIKLKVAVRNGVSQHTDLAIQVVPSCALEADIGSQ